MSTRQLHFDFSHLDLSVEYTFRHGVYEAPLRRHSHETRRHAARENPLLTLVDENHLTHFVEADLPEEMVVLIYVTKAVTVGGRPFDHPVHMAIHIPHEGREHVRHRAIRERGDRAPGLHPKLARHRPSAEAIRRFVDAGNEPEFPAHIDNLQDATDAAVALLFHHGNLINLNTDNGGATPATIVEHCIVPAVNATLELPLAILGQGDAWLVATPVDGTTSLQPSDATMAAVTGPLQAALVTSQNLASLEGQQWNANYGVTSAPYGGTSNSATLAAAFTADDTGGWVSKDITQMNGLTVDGGSVTYTPASTTPNWTANGLWSLNDTVSLTAAIAAEIAAGNVNLQISDTAWPQGALRGTLVPGTPDPDTQLTPFTVAFAPLPGVTTQMTATATFTLNTGGTGLTYTVSVQNSSGETGASLHLAGDTSGNILYDVPLSDMSGTDTLSFQVTNNWLRHLSACVQYLDVGGNVLDPQNWSDKVPAFVRASFEPDSQKPLVALIPPVSTVFGVPIGADPTTISIPIWEEVHTVRLLLGGLGRGSYDGAVCPIGITVTALAELALPVFLLAAGTAVTNSAPVKALMADSEVLFAVCAAGTFLVAGPTAAYIGLAQDPGAAASGLAEKFGPLLLSPVSSLGKWIAGKLVEGAAERAAPFVDIALAIINGAVTAAELSQTIIEVLDSPFVYESDISRSMGLNVTLVPDTRFNKFPDYHDILRVTVVYDGGATTPVYVETLPPTTLSDPITISFTSVPAGGRLRIYACFFAANGWQSGQAVSDWIPALPTDGALTIDNLMVTTNEIPLSSGSVYIHQEKIGMVDGALDWIGAVGTPPTQTVTSPAPFAGQGKEVLRLSGITTAQEPEMLGYAWQATGLDLPPDNQGTPPTDDALWTMQNISVLQHPQLGYAAPPIGFTQTPGIAYNMASADNDATNFFLDSSNPNFDIAKNPTGGWHARALPLAHGGAAPSFAVASNQSYGRFPSAMDRYVYHPAGYLFGINFAAHKLYRLQLASAPVADADAPFAVLSSGQGVRDGLMYDPIGIAVALDGRVLVLESGNTRVQAFDIYGNAVPYFANPDYDPNDPNSAKTIPTLALKDRGPSTYLDISVESQGYIYVLSYTGDGSEPSMYQVDLYTPAGAFLVSTPNVAAARMVVNILRDLYTLNYEQFLDGNGRVQPSISMWLPPAPDPSQIAHKGGRH